MFKISKTFLIISILASLLFYASPNLCQSLTFRSTLLGYHLGGQMTFDIYKPFASIYFNMRRLEKPVALQKGEEGEIYLQLERRLLLPSYLLFQITGYPLSALSSYLETDRYNSYNRFKTYADLNIMRSIGAGFEEPYAFSAFLGNAVFLAYQDSSENRKKQSGSALAGFLVSTGKHQIYNNIYLHDSWYQIEMMLVGNLNEPKKRRVFWNFRIGFKSHQNDFLRDKFTLSVERSHTEWKASPWSFFKNTVFKYKAYFPLQRNGEKKISDLQSISIGKKIPVTLFNRTVFPVFSFGVRWEWIRHYDHALKKFDPIGSRQLTWLIQPNIEF